MQICVASQIPFPSVNEQYYSIHHPYNLNAPPFFCAKDEKGQWNLALHLDILNEILSWKDIMTKFKNL